MLCCFCKMNSGNNNNNNNNNDEKKRPWYIPPFLFRSSTYPPANHSTQTQNPNQATSLNTSSLGSGNSSGNNNTANSVNIPDASSNLNNNEGFSKSADASVSSAAITGGGDSDAPLLLSEKVTSKRGRDDDADVSFSNAASSSNNNSDSIDNANRSTIDLGTLPPEVQAYIKGVEARAKQAEETVEKEREFYKPYVPTETVNDLLNCTMLPKPLPDTRLRRSISSSKKQKGSSSKGINSINTSTKTESVSVSSVDRTTKTIDYVKLGKREVWSKEEFLHHLHKAENVKMKDNAFLNILLNTLVPIEAMKLVRKTNSWVYNENYVSIIEDEDLVENALDEFSWGVLKSVFYMDILQKYVQQFTILKGFSEWQKMDEKEKKEIKTYEELAKTTNRLQNKKKRWEKKFKNPSPKQLEKLNKLKQEIEEIAQKLSGKPVSVLKDAKTDQFIELVGHTEGQRFVVLVEVKPDAKHPMGKVNHTLGFNTKDLDGFSEDDKKMIMNLVESNEKAKGNDVEEEEENDDDDGAEDINDSNGNKKQKDKNEFVIEDLHNIEEFKKVYFGNLVEWTTSPFNTLLKGDQQCSLRQVLQYMCVNKIRYSIITTLQKWHFCKLESSTTKGGEAILKVAGPFDSCDNHIFDMNYTVRRILMYFILAADDWKFEHPEEEIPTYKELIQNKSQNGNNKPGGGNGSNDTSSSSNAGQKKGGRTLPGASNNKTTSTTTTTGTVAKENAQQSNIINSDENDEADEADDEEDEEEVDDDSDNIEEDSKNTTKPYWIGEITLYDLIQNRAMEIGRGRGCYIYLMLFEYNVMVVKCLNYKSPYDRDCDAEAIRMEIVNEERIYEVLHSIQGKCIPKLFYAGEMTAGWVDGIATSFEGHDLDEKDVVIDQSFINNALGVLDQIHSLGVVHGDIALRNILKREEDGKPFIIDFGFARTSEEIMENGEDDPKDLMKDERDELKRILIERLKNQKSSSSMPLSEVAKIDDNGEMTSVIEPKEINIGTRNSKKRHLDELNTGIIS